MEEMALRRDLDLLLVDLLLQETEDTWDRIAKSINALADLCREGACESPQALVPAMKGISRPLISALNSERTRLSGPAIDLVGTTAIGLGPDFDPLLSIFFPSLLILCARTNKVVAARARACVLTIIRSTQLPSVLSYLLQYSKDKAPSLRLVVAEGTLACLNCFNPPDLEKETRAKDVESLIRITANDPAADVRRISRDIFEAYKLLLPTRVASFIAPLSPITKKYLDIKLYSDGSTTLHRPNSSLAASTSSARSSQSVLRMVQERPKSSSSIRKTNPSKPTKPNTEVQRPASSKPAIVRAPTKVHRIAAQRITVTTSRSNSPQGRPTQAAAAVRARSNETQVLDGPKRMALPETTSVQETKQGLQTGNFNVPEPDVAIPPRPPLTKKLVGSSTSIIRAKAQTRIADEKKIPKPLPRSQSTAQIQSGKISRTAPRVRNVSKPTQSQLAKVRAVAKPAASSKTNNPASLKRHPKLRQGDSSSPEPQSQITAPTSAGQPVDNAGQTEDHDELQTTRDSNNETPRKSPFDDFPDCSLVNKTPITTLLTSIEQGFLLSPFSPLSPPQSYLEKESFDVGHFPLRLPKKEGSNFEDRIK